MNGTMEDRVQLDFTVGAAGICQRCGCKGVYMDLTQLPGEAGEERWQVSLYIISHSYSLSGLLHVINVSMIDVTCITGSYRANTRVENSVNLQEVDS